MSRKKKKNTAKGLITLDRLLYKAKVVKTSWYLYKNKHSDQWNIIESPVINADTYGQLIYYKGGKNMQ